MRRTTTALLLALSALACASALIPGSARAQCIENGACLLPQSGCGYSLTGPITYGVVEIRNINLSTFSQCMPTQPPGFSINSFFDVFVELEISLNGGATWQPASTTGHGTEHAVGRADGVTFDTEMLALDIHGGSLPPGVMIRESPTLQSTGMTTIQPMGGGTFRIDSFFDIFTELSLDGGQTWTPSNGSAHPTVVPRGVTAAHTSTWGELKLRYH